MSDLHAAIDKALRARTLDLVYVEYDDRLSDDQIQAYLSTGDTSGEFDIWVTDTRYAGLEDVAKEIASELEDEFPDDDIAGEITDNFYELAYDLDTSDAFAQLARQTSRVNATFLLMDLPKELDRPETPEELLSALGLTETDRNLTAAQAVLDTTGAGEQLSPALAVFTDAETLFSIRDRGARVTDGHLVFTDGSAVAFDLDHEIVRDSGKVDSRGRGLLNVFVTDAFDGTVFHLN